ncbi:MAG: hypothetical protein IAB93_03070 [Bacteroidetes bacterium]|uniref:Cell division protein FtsX n=1 Tax=Candidatus Merdivivens pullistercoris TaxID=2840873 RepID=A0A9D9I338_9BACT|nr:hypothetical protein [Candidatus Merdivivens pullistercoris]
MSVREKGIISRRIAQSYLSSVISISLVLFLVGGAAMVISNAKSVSDYFRENMKISAELSLSADETSALSLAKKIEGMDGIKSVEYISREQGIREMEEQLGSGFLDVFETPPIPISLEISLDAAYVEADSLKIIEERITDIPGVDGLYYQQSLFDSLNDNIEKAGAVLAFFILLLLFISFVLIGNTVRLNLYSKRFTIYAMQLVGATKGFIRKPFMIQAFFQGLIAGMVAVLGIIAALIVVKNDFSGILEAVDPEAVMGSLVFVAVLGIFICMVSTAAVINKLVGFSKDDLYL